MKTGMRILWAAATALGLLAVPAASQAETVVKTGLSLPKDLPGFDSITGLYELFKTEVEAGTKGEIKLDLVYNNGLGAPNDRLNMMRRGVIQMTDASDGNYASIYPDVQVLSIPYLFPSEQVAWKVLDGPFGQKIAEEIRQKTGIRIFGYWESGGYKHYSSNKPIHGPADMKGLKMRALGPVFAKTVEAMGGSATAINFGELYTSLKTGVVDGQDNAIAVFSLVKLYEVQKYLTLSRHIYSMGMLAMNDAFYNGLTAEQKQVVQAAAKKAIEFNRTRSRASEAELLKQMEAKGLTVVQPTSAAMADFAKATQQPVIDWLKTQVTTPALIDEAFAAVRQAEGK